MTIFYILFIENIFDGIFSLGRCIDLFQLDVIIALLGFIVYYENKRWVRLRDR